MRLRKGRRAVLTLFALAVVSCANEGEMPTDRIPLSIGETTVDLIIHRAPEAGLTYLNLHDDENTAVQAAIDVVRERGGTLLELRHTGDRNLSFRLSDSTFTVDPNRIFTSHGIDATLAAHGSSTPASRAAVRSFADDLLGHLHLEERPLVVAVHNNSDDRYSVLSYADGGALAADARFVHVDVDEDRDDFYFVTSEVLYNSLRASGGNVVMQDNDLVEDDGSLSVFAGRHGVDYVNVEAEHGHLEKQREMIAALHDLIVAAEGK